MSLTKTMDVQAAGMRVASRSTVHRIEVNNVKNAYKNMPSWRILLATVSFLGYRHRVGLLITALVVSMLLPHLHGLVNAFFIVQGTLGL